MRDSRLRRGMVRSASRLAAQGRESPSRRPSGTSCGIARTVVVTSTTRTRVR